MNDLESKFRRLLELAGTANQISGSAYDTAWVARLGERDERLAERAAQWLIEHKLPDGGWGAKELRYGHDRFISTLAAMIALVKNGWDHTSLQAEREALERYTKDVLRDPAGATIGFELIVPTLIDEAKQMGLVSYADNALLRGLRRVRTSKLNILSNQKITRHISPAFSSEMVGTDLHLLDLDNLQHPNGSVECSPSATAFFASQARPGDPAAMSYLRTVLEKRNGSVPYLWPLDIFEQAWSLWNLALVGLDSLDSGTLSICQRHLDALEEKWSPQQGMPIVSDLAYLDVDTTSIVFDILTKYGRDVSIDAVLHYEQETHFRCYALETDPSMSANVHALWALRVAGYDAEHPTAKKIVSFLRNTRTGRLFWVDKWNTSPYYPTAHAAMVLLDYDEEMADDAMYWIRETQNENGAWGFYQTPTAEETAYALQALITWKHRGGEVSNEVLNKGADWLAEHADPPYPPLWTGKSLYCPTLVVQSAVLSALMLAAK